MAFYGDFPFSFDAALRAAKSILARRPELLEKGVVDTEAEQIVLAAYRNASGKSLSRGELFLRIRDAYPSPAGEQVVIWATQRSEGRLLQHLIGTQIFLDHEYEVGADVLVPRPETEVLATIAFATLAEQPLLPERGFEIGLGSGVLSIELLARFPSLQMVATELKPDAAERARRNALRILGPGAQGVERLRITMAASEEQVFEAIQSGQGAGDFVISNPPYLIASDPIDEEVIRHEPRSALFAPEADPIHFYRKIAEQAPARLKRGAWAFLEVPPERSQLIAGVFRNNGWEPEILPDLTQRDRVIRAKLI